MNWKLWSFEVFSGKEETKLMPTTSEGIAEIERRRSSVVSSAKPRRLRLEERLWIFFISPGKSSILWNETPHHELERVE